MTARRVAIAGVLLLGTLTSWRMEAQQLALTSVASDGTETPVAAVFGFGQVAAGDSKDIHFRARNTGTTAVSVDTFAVTAPSGSASASSGSAFTLVNSQLPPYAMNPTDTVDFWIRISTVALGSYSGTLQLDSQNVILLASAVVAPTLTVATPCSGPTSSGDTGTTNAPASSANISASMPNGTIDFGSAPQGGQVSCVFTLQNPTLPNPTTQDPSPQALPVSPVTLTGAAFTALAINGASTVSGIGSGVASTSGITIPANQPVTFTLAFAATSASATAYTATLALGTRIYALTGTGNVSSTPSAVTSLGLTSVASDGTQTAVGSSYDYGSVAVGDNRDVHFKVRNTGSAAVTISTLVAVGGAFAVVNSPTPPFVIAPANVLDFWVRFSAASANTYNGTLTINGQLLALQATAVPAPTLTVGLPCTEAADTNSSGAISFPRAQTSGPVACVFTLKNSNAQPLTVAPLTLTGTGFSGLATNTVSISASQSVPFSLTFTPTTSSDGKGTLVIGTRTYALTGAGLLTSLPKPILTFDSSAIFSGQQHTLAITLPSPAPIAASGTLTLTFNSQAQGVADDSAIQFVATNKRQASFAVKAGDTAVTLGGFPNIVFSTGTTTGQIVFSMSASVIGFTGDPTTAINVAPAAMAVSAASATRRVNDLDITVTGFDNTYTAGAMAFSFYDRSGGLVAPPVAANFSANFQTLYKGQTAGSAFLMGVTFPVTGDATQIGAVDVTLNNSAGSTKSARLNFP